MQVSEVRVYVKAHISVPVKEIKLNIKLWELEFITWTGIKGSNCKRVKEKQKYFSEQSYSYRLL
jgi:hypothetical protein